MKKFAPHIIPALFLFTLMNSCSNQRYVSSESDDIYYSSIDRAQENSGDYNTVREINGDDYKTQDAAPVNGYYSLGKEINDLPNPNAAAAYSEGQMARNEVMNEAQTENGAVVNNFYGNTTYAEGDYYDESYASRIRRFDRMNAGYGYYDPFYMDPFWNYGWSAWDPYPRAGWSIGYNSWYGWNVGYNVGWGYPAWGYNNYCTWRSWNDPYYYNNPYMNGCYGGFGYYPYGFGYNPYRNGYWNGYRDGYFDGNTWGGVSNNSRPVINSRSRMGINNGFSGNVASDARDSRVQSRETLARTGLANNSNVVLRDDVAKTRRASENQNSNHSNTDEIRRNSQSIQNSNANVAADKYGKRNRSVATSKYDLSGEKTPSNNSSSTVSRDRAINSYSGSGRTTYNKNQSDRRASTPSTQRPRATNHKNSTRTRTSTNVSRPKSSTSTNSSPRTYRPSSERNTVQPKNQRSVRRPANTTTRSNHQKQNKVNTSTQSRTRSYSPSPSRSNSGYRAPKSSKGNFNRSGGSSSPRMSSPSGSSSPSRSGGGSSTTRRR